MTIFAWILKERKYWKPKSVTWWGAVVPLVIGIVKAFGYEFHTGIYDVVAALYGAADATTLINAGVIGIGLRGAIK